MGKLAEWMKLNAREGSNLAEFEELERQLTFEGVTDKNKALEIMKRDGSVFKSALDTAVSEAVQSHDLKFNTDKLPGILESERQKIKDEMNPPKTEEQKKLAEMQKTIDSMAAKELRADLVKTLRAKAKEVGYPEDMAERFAVYGENAPAELAKEAEFLTSHIKTNVESEIKTLYGNQLPPKQSSSDPSKIMGRADFESLSPKAKSEFFASGGDVTE